MNIWRLINYEINYQNKDMRKQVLSAMNLTIIFQLFLNILSLLVINSEVQSDIINKIAINKSYLYFKICHENGC